VAAAVQAAMAPAARRPALPPAPARPPVPVSVPPAHLPVRRQAVQCAPAPVRPPAAHVLQATGGARHVQARITAPPPARRPAPPRPSPTPAQPLRGAQAVQAKPAPTHVPTRIAPPAPPRLPVPRPAAGQPVVQPFFPMLALTALGGALGYSYAGAAATALATTAYATAGALGGWVTGWVAEDLYERYYGPTVAIVTISGFSLDSPNLSLLSQDDVIIKNNYDRLRNRFPYAKRIALGDLNPDPIPAATLRGVTTLYILGHGEDEVGTVGLLDVDTLYKVLGQNVVKELAKGGNKEEKTRILRECWKIREINLVSCNSASQRGGATNIASSLAAKFQTFSNLLGYRIVVRGVDGYATVNRRGEVLNVPRNRYKSWMTDLDELRKDVKKSKLSTLEIRRRNQTILDTYSTGTLNDFASYQTN
jgi:hypothetical protein